MRVQTAKDLMNIKNILFNKSIILLPDHCHLLGLPLMPAPSRNGPTLILFKCYEYKIWFINFIFQKHIYKAISLPRFHFKLPKYLFLSNFFNMWLFSKNIFFGRTLYFEDSTKSFSIGKIRPFKGWTRRFCGLLLQIEDFRWEMIRLNNLTIITSADMYTE